MALLGLDAAATEALIADYPQVTVGIYNSPRQTVIAGPTEQIDELIARVRAQNRFASRVNIEVPRTIRPWMRCSRRCVRSWPI